MAFLLKSLLTAAVLPGLTVAAAHAQGTVANYAHGRPGTAQYEHLSFWTTADGRPADITYAYGKDRKEVTLRYAGPDKVSDKPAFKVRFANGHMLYILPAGTTLRVTADKLAAPKTYRWEYEGPVNGIGTFCQPCAGDEKNAMQLVQGAYLK